MAEMLKVELVTPEKMLFSGMASLVEAPGIEGNFGVLPGHAPFVSLLRPGMVRIETPGGEREIFVSSGLAQIEGEQCAILAEHVYDMREITVSKAQELLNEAQKELAACKQGSNEMRIAERRLQACETLYHTISGR